MRYVWYFSIPPGSKNIRKEKKFLMLRLPVLTDLIADLKTRHGLAVNDRHRITVSWGRGGLQTINCQAEMEAFLEEVRNAAQQLVEALDRDADLSHRFDGSPGSLDLLPKFIASRQAVGEAQSAYDDANDKYRQFVASLSPAVRPEAARLGAFAITGAKAI